MIMHYWENYALICWYGLGLASLIIMILSLRRRGLAGFCFGLLSMFGAALCSLLIFGLVVAFEDPGGPFQKDSLFLNGAGLIGIALFITGAHFGLSSNKESQTGFPRIEEKRCTNDRSSLPGAFPARRVSERCMQRIGNRTKFPDQRCWLKRESWANFIEGISVRMAHG